jgi:hypothetical protein
MIIDLCNTTMKEASVIYHYSLLFSAFLSLVADELLEYIYDYGYSSEQIAEAMQTDINLVALKVAHLAQTGHKLCSLDYRSDFLK